MEEYIEGAGLSVYWAKQTPGWQRAVAHLHRMHRGFRDLGSIPYALNVVFCPCRVHLGQGD